MAESKFVGEGGPRQGLAVSSPGQMQSRIADQAVTRWPCPTPRAELQLERQERLISLFINGS